MGKKGFKHGFQKRYTFRHHLAEESPRTFLAYTREEAEAAAVKAGLSFERCGRCGDFEWYLDKVQGVATDEIFWEEM